MGDAMIVVHAESEQDRGIQSHRSPVVRGTMGYPA